MLKSNMFKFTSSKYFLIVSLFFIFSINSCGIYKYSDARKNPTNADERVEKNQSEGKGFRLSNLGKKSGGDFQFATSNPLWRAGLEKLNFAPLSNVDYAGGIIVTDWFSEGNSSDQIKITIRFLTNEIRSDALDVIIHKKTCDTKNICKTNKIESTLNTEIRFAILKRAALLEKTDLKTAKEKRGKYKIPGSNEDNKKN
jgi:hypothetical protein